MQDEVQLILKAQAGDAQAMNDVLISFAPLVKSISRAFHIIGADREDLSQIGMIGLMNAVRTYRTDGAAKFKTYATKCVRNIMLDAVRKQKSAVQTVNLDESAEDVSSEPEKLYLDSEAQSILNDTIAAALNDTEKEVLALYLDAMSYAEISKKLGMTKKKVDNTIYSLRKKIKKILEIGRQAREI